MLVKNQSRRSLFLHWGKKKQKAQFTKAQLPSPNRGNQTRAAGGAATKRGLGERKSKERQKFTIKMNSEEWFATGYQWFTVIWQQLHDWSFKAAEFRERWQGPGVQLRPASHHAAPVRREKEREWTKETLTEILAPKRWAEPHNYSSSAAKIMPSMKYKAKQKWTWCSCLHY